MRKVSQIKYYQFCEKLKQKYGEGILTDLQDLKTKSFLTLMDIAKKHGLTRERIRQIFKKYHGVPYTKYIRKKRIKINKDIINLNCPNNPLTKVANYEKDSLVFKGALGEKMAMDMCDSLGFNVQIPCGQTFDLYVNGYEVDVKTAYKSVNTYFPTDRRYFRFSISKKQWSIDFLICIVFPYKEFYIIPQKVFTSHRGMMIPDKKTSLSKRHPQSKFLKYKKAWHLFESMV